ncbi:MAG: PASTA domain-containing protein [Oscillospiraceae bacterium]|nr:PASTA domain-containing protein [Oscillospiraceae bacterium]
MEKEKLCLRCMRKIGNNDTCPYCSKEEGLPQELPHLPLKTIVGGKYLVGKLVGTNSEGSTYYAFDMERKVPVTLRELFPKEFLSRGEGNYSLVNVGKAAEFIDTKEEFLKLWRTLEGLSNFTALTEVYDIIEDLGTVFAVTEYLGDGKSLRDYLLEQEQGFISWEEARVLLMPVLSALGELHRAGIVHGAISPETLILDKNGKLRITGYSIEKVRRQKTVLECEIFDGYAAVEQYGFSSGLGSATDIYAFSAVLYRTLIGSTPMSSSSRLANDKLMIPGKFAEMLPAYVINALVNGLQILPDDRTATAEQLRDELSASPTAQSNASEEYSSVYAAKDEENKEDIDELIEKEVEAELEENKVKKSTVVTFVISAILCLAILIASLVALKGFSKEDDEETTAPNYEDLLTGEDLLQSSSTTEADDDVIFMSTPTFVGKYYDDIKDNEEYKKLFVFSTEYEESDEDIGVITFQNINPGTEVTSLNPRTIKIKISSGRVVPDLIGVNVSDAKSTLKNAGFKNVELSSQQKEPTKESDSGKVYSVVYEDSQTGDWKSIPNDRHLSSSVKIIVYYYGDYENTAESTTANEPILDHETDIATDQ